MARLSFVLTILLTFALWGCDNKAEKPAEAEAAAPTSTKAAAAAPAPAPAPAAAPAAVTPTPTKPGTATGLEGSWVMDLAGFKALPEFAKLSPQEKQMAEQMFSVMKMDLTIGADTIKMDGELMGKKQTRETSYKVIKQEGNVYTVEVSGKDGKKAKTQVMEVKGNQLLLRDGKMLVVMKRK